MKEIKVDLTDDEKNNFEQKIKTGRYKSMLKRLGVQIKENSTVDETINQLVQSMSSKPEKIAKNNPAVKLKTNKSGKSEDFNLLVKSMVEKVRKSSGVKHAK